VTSSTSAPSSLTPPPSVVAASEPSAPSSATEPAAEVA
jgi:hypothetical protein